MTEGPRELVASMGPMSGSNETNRVCAPAITFRSSHDGAYFFAGQPFPVLGCVCDIDNHLPVLFHRP
jgi:hypothetical protein